MDPAPDRLGLFRPVWRLLTFRLTVDEFLALDRRHLVLGLVTCWLVGIGRYWDNPRAVLIQHLGLGSVVYAAVLAAFLYRLTKPLKPENWSYRRVLTYVALTGPPAAIYAIPVERFMPLDQAQNANLAFLGIVAAWRVALLVLLFRRYGRLTWFRTVLATLLPLAIIVFALAVLNLEHVVFRIMGGLTRENRSSHDAAYAWIWLLGWLSVLLLPFLLLIYLVVIVVTRRRRKQETSETSAEDAEDAA